MTFFKQHRATIVSSLFLIVAFNLYFIFLVPQGFSFYLIYFDVLLCILFFFIYFITFYRYHQKQKQKQALLMSDELILPQYPQLLDSDIIEHDFQLLKQVVQDQYQRNCDLQDDLAKWCHEVKLPLSALLLMNEKVSDPTLRLSIKDQLARITQLLNTALLSCKIQSNYYDFQVKEVDLARCVHASIHNLQFFFIKEHFELQLEPMNETIFTDQEWLIYALDQLLANAIKYHEASPILHIWCEKHNREVHLYLEDNGIGIQDSDLPNIFERGFTGSNHHNGSYQSTGMGLYLVSFILTHLGHEIIITSEYGKYTRCELIFQDNREHFHR